MQLTEYDRPLLPITLSVIAGLTVGLALPGGKVAAGGVAVLTLLFLIIACFGNKRLRFSPLFLFAATGYLLIQPAVDFNHGKDHITTYANGSKYLITGTIDSTPVKKNRCYRFVLEAETVKGTSHPATCTSGKISVSAYAESLMLKQGDRIAFKSKIRRFRNFKNPGAFDYERFMAFEKIWASAYTNGKKIEICYSAAPSTVTTIQNTIIHLVEENVKNHDSRSVLKALIIGDKYSIRSELRQAFNRTGTGHLLAISGLHIGIVAAFSFTFFSFLLSFSTRLLWSGKILSIAGLMSLLPVAAYGVVAGMSPSTQRAVIMVGVMLLSYSCAAEYDLATSLALAAMVILVISPVSLFSVSFQLSFSAVCAITAGVLIHQAAEKTGETDDSFLQICKTRLLSYTFISFLAYAGTLPFVLYYFNQVSLIGMAANFVLIPVVGFFVVPFGLLAVLISSVSLPAGGLLISVTGFVLEKALLMIQSLAELPFASVKMVTPTLLEIVFCYLFFYLLLYRVYKQRKGETVNRKKVRAAVAVFILFVAVDASFFVHKRFFHNSFIVTVIDVGQGSAALLELPDGKTMLIDGGGFSDNRAFDVGEKIIAPFLWKKRIRTIDCIVLTHPESDHLNGLLYVLENFNVKVVWSNGEERRSESYRAFHSSIEKKKIEHPPFNELNRALSYGGVSFEILYPFSDYMEKRKEEKWRGPNNNSLVVRAEYQGVSFLFPGDIMKRAEAELTNYNGGALKSTVLLVPHHGSKTSSSTIFLQAVRPSFAIVSAGWMNRFKMPHASVLETLKKAGADIYRTDQHGAVVMTVKDDSFHLTTTSETSDSSSLFCASQKFFPEE